MLTSLLTVSKKEKPTFNQEKCDMTKVMIKMSWIQDSKSLPSKSCGIYRSNLHVAYHGSSDMHIPWYEP